MYVYTYIYNLNDDTEKGVLLDIAGNLLNMTYFLSFFNSAILLFIVPKSKTFWSGFKVVVFNVKYLSSA